MKKKEAVADTMLVLVWLVIIIVGISHQATQQKIYDTYKDIRYGNPPVHSQ